MIDALSQGGAEKQLVLLASGLKGKGYDVKLTTYHQIENFYEKDLKRDEISLEVIPSGKSKIKGILGLRNLIKDWHPDIVICFKDGPSMLACLTRLTCKFNLVVSERNTTQSLSKKEKLKFFLYRLADFIIPNSQSQASFIAHNYPNLSPKVSVINNMVDL